MFDPSWDEHYEMDLLDMRADEFEELQELLAEEEVEED